ncbi:DNA mismatch repair protein Mlh1-like [Sinocyclocheilus grahami]|uniref:DNA mismatch repair protein Mlh1-like n=1 Tax=Sinocyclocheilus grahami TaxID=75366 RepID=UPI0007ACA209|nr:PREDICTED: DNA mismatch repair protein Mlh1-like [Sinocyclocheilus grahami]
MLLDNYSPAMEGLPMFSLLLATEVNCDREECLECSHFYSIRKRYTVEPDAEEPQVVQMLHTKTRWKEEHVLFKAPRSLFSPPKHFSEDGSVLQIARLPELYKVFERC